MTVWSPDASDQISLVSDLAAMASSVDDEIAEVISVRQAHSYVWDDSTDRTAQLGMTPGSTGAQLDTGGIYTYINTTVPDWYLTGGSVPTFVVKGDDVQSITADGSTSYDTLDALWATPEVNTGFSSWTSGVLTIQTAGVYMLNAAVVFDANGTGNRYVAIAESSYTTAPSTAFYQRLGLANLGAGADVLVGVTTFAVLDVGDTVKVAVWQTSGGALSTDSSTPSQNQLNVRYLGPAIDL